MESILSDVCQANPVHLDYKNPDLTSLQELPESYAWTQLNDGDHDYPPGDSSVSESVPVIDLNDPNAAHLIGHACKTWGVFQVINHGIPNFLLDDTECTTRALFSLPLEQKLKASRSPGGVSGYGMCRISSFFSRLMWSEGFTVVGSPLDHFRQLWPEDYIKHCEAIEEFDKEMIKLAGRLLWLMLGSLGITKKDINWAGPKGDFEDICSATQLNHYPVCPDPNRAMGMAAHTDSTLLTIIYQNSISGLQVLKEGTGWVIVPPVPDGLVVNVGDLLHILSNGLYPSVLHRAMVNGSKSRISIACLCGPQAGVQISPLPKLVSPSHPPLYREITWSGYLEVKAKHFDKALSTIRVDSSDRLVDVNEMDEDSIQVNARE